VGAMLLETSTLIAEELKIYRDHAVAEATAVIPNRSEFSFEQVARVFTDPSLSSILTTGVSLAPLISWCENPCAWRTIRSKVVDLYPTMARGD